MAGTASDDIHCRCSLPFVRAVNDNYHYCENCDNAQEIESTVVGRSADGGGYYYGARRRTKFDHQYDLALEQDKKRWYGNEGSP